jgi:hypothetical protein
LFFSRTLNTTLYFNVFENENHPDNTIVVSNCLPNKNAHNLNFYHNSKLNTDKFGTYFKKAYLWDHTNNAPYNVETYIGNGEKWTKI